MQSVLDAFGRDLGLFLQPFAHDFAADALVVLGGIANLFDSFGDDLQQALGDTPVIRGRLGARAAPLGAAALYAG